MLILVIIKASFIVRESGRQKETFSLMKLDTMDITSSHQSMLEINLKKHSAMKWYIVKKSQGTVNSRKKMFYFHGKFEIRIIKQANPTHLDLTPNSIGE